MKTALQIALSALLAAAVAFYGGVTYGRSNGVAGGTRGGFAAQGAPGQAGANAVRFRGGFAGGEVISAEGKSITVKSADGSTRTVYFDSNTRVLRSEEATLTDLAKGSTVVVTGTSGDDGSVTARSVQIVPKGSNLGVFGGGMRGGVGGPQGMPGGGQGGNGSAGSGQQGQGGPPAGMAPDGDVMMAPPPQ